MNLRKAQLARSRIELLGFIVDEDTVRPNEQKLNAILHFPWPNNVKRLQRFLMMIGFYRKFFPNSSDMARLLHELLRKGATWTWRRIERRHLSRLYRKRSRTRRAYDFRASTGPS